MNGRWFVLVLLIGIAGVPAAVTMKGSEYSHPRSTGTCPSCRDRVLAIRYGTGGKPTVTVGSIAVHGLTGLLPVLRSEDETFVGGY